MASAGVWLKNRVGDMPLCGGSGRQEGVKSGWENN